MPLAAHSHQASGDAGINLIGAYEPGPQILQFLQSGDGLPFTYRARPPMTVTTHTVTNHLHAVNGQTQGSPPIQSHRPATSGATSGWGATRLHREEHAPYVRVSTPSEPPEMATRDTSVPTASLTPARTSAQDTSATSTRVGGDERPRPVPQPAAWRAWPRGHDQDVQPWSAQCLRPVQPARLGWTRDQVGDAATGDSNFIGDYAGLRRPSRSVAEPAAIDLSGMQNTANYQNSLADLELQKQQEIANGARHPDAAPRFGERHEPSARRS